MQPFSAGGVLARAAVAMVRNAPLLLIASALVLTPLVLWRVATLPSFEEVEKLLAYYESIKSVFDKPPAEIEALIWRSAKADAIYYGLLVLSVTLIAGLVARPIRSSLSTTASWLDDNSDTPSGDMRATAVRSGSNWLTLVPLLLLLALVITLGVIAGTACLLIPGIMILTAWFVAAPAMAVENKGIADSLRRSAQLTRGARWGIFGILFLSLVVSLVLSLVIGMALGPIHAGSYNTHIWTPIALNLVLVIFGAVCQVVAYHDLVTLKEGPSAPPSVGS